MCGALCVMTLGAALMQLWCVNSWDTLLSVRHKHLLLVYLSALEETLCIYQQMLCPFTMVTLVLVLDQSSSTIFTAVAVRLTSSIVHIVPFSAATGVTPMMLV